MLKKWDNLPEWMKIPEVKIYYEILSKRKMSLLLKKIFDVVMAAILLIILALPMLVIAGLILLDSPGTVFYRQERVSAYGKIFRIHKFRTMEKNADKMGSQVTVNNDKRITKVGAILRKYRLDEIPQLLDVLSGNMSFVGTRPEAVKYVKMYKPEYLATLLLPAGITSETSIRYKSEDKMLSDLQNVDQIYVEEILPEKMKMNLISLTQFCFWKEVLTMCRTVIAVFGKDYSKEEMI